MKGSIVPSVLILFVGFVGFDHGRHGRRTWVKPGFWSRKKVGIRWNQLRTFDASDFPMSLFHMIPTFFLHFYVLNILIIWNQLI